MASTASVSSERVFGSDRVAKLAANSDFLFAVGLVGVLATLLIPLPTFLLDVGLACSISLAIAVLIIVLAASEPLELSTFPSLLLITTLFRLSLNVASTRLVLLQGNAGTIISTFGNFVAGGNLVVGLVMFLILVVIQFVVITKGAGRISEVSARFILDAMPGKQMSIDADLNAGIITDKEAKQRRDAIVRESEFYGAMDGASKFISGDAKAGLIITAINLVGGILLGWTRGMPIASALRQYSILTIGDGLVSQIPSLIIAVSSGFLVTKIRSENTVGYDMTRQMFKQPQALLIAATIIGVFALVPGFPKVPFLLISAVLWFLGWGAKKQTALEKTAAKSKPEAAKSAVVEEPPVEEILQADVLSILVGVRLISLVDPRRQSSVFERIGALRKKIAQKLGFIFPLVRLRDDINLEPSSYEIRLYDHVIASGRLEPDKYLAMDSGAVQKPIKGIPTKEPVYGLPALWISAADKETAELNGYTVIDPESVLITHLSETVMRHAHELLTREDVQQLLERLRKVQPSLVGEVVPEVVSVGLVQRVLQNLLKEGISIRDLPLILEALGEHGGRTKNAALLTECARKALARTITERCKGSDGKIHALTLEPALEHSLLNCVQQGTDAITLAVPPEAAAQLNQAIAQAWKSAMDKGVEEAVLLCDARIRPGLVNLISRFLPRLSIAAYDEICAGTPIQTVETISLPEASSVLSPMGDAVAV
ncbi:MAG TPA: flagellar biosynthesis protein FlhA [Anaerohalosphaeraceae bacterium]|nr:flagellar biosynthesis protein FlhA [Anaerohalosphaeraceae bacterium]HOT72454.1 flagellar biosynthesis protein FlhA [Anaerohalosphaeraceae bacterium]HPB92597.1 flagellar biosynthesis protein FlhA [Anaerohalosphaeraceae bacterium]HQG05961.1 flagellar biosynthesis protein FlhA [Anaerohalosphaeraceae bacterium]HQI07243.1 flagellar biosynthesis protein FlhA [Anaerohalosphaeraceae bacterium]